MFLFVGALFSGLLALVLICLVVFGTLATIIGFVAGWTTYLFSGSVDNWKNVWMVVTFFICLLGLIELISIL